VSSHSTDPRVPRSARLGLGLAALGRPGYINLGHGDDLPPDRGVDAMRAHAHAVLDAAWAEGVRWFDAARSYGRAEEFLGAWLRARGIEPGAATVSSKWGYTYTAQWRVDAEKHEVKDHSLSVLRRQWKETEAELGPRLSLYQIHSATLESGVLEDRTVLAQLALYRQSGVRIGLSLSGPRQAGTLARALAVTVDGQRLFDAVQATWNLLERSAAPALAEAKERGLTVLLKEALANGRLSPRAAPHELAPLRRHAARLHTTVDALALAAALAQPFADVVLSGAATVEHMRSNATATKVAWDDEAAAELAALAEAPEVYWRKRGALAWS
jgi:aryl-alcohol dehydrogenase-like predicted oxidoreductase